MRFILQGVEQFSNSVLYFLVPISIALVDEFLGAAVYIAINASNYFITIFRSLFFQSLSYFGQKYKYIYFYLLDSAVLLYAATLSILLLMTILFKNQYVNFIAVLITFVLSDIARVKFIVHSRFKWAIFTNITALFLATAVYLDWDDEALGNVLNFKWYFFIIFLPYLIAFFAQLNIVKKLSCKRLSLVPIKFTQHSIFNNLLFSLNISGIYILINQNPSASKLIILFGVYLQLSRLSSPLQQFLNQIYMFYFAKNEVKIGTLKFETYFNIILFMCVLVTMLLGVSIIINFLKLPAELSTLLIFLLSLDGALVIVYIRYSKMLQSVRINYQTSLGMLGYTLALWSTIFYSSFDVNISQLALGMLFGRLTYFIIVMFMFWINNGKFTTT